MTNEEIKDYIVFLRDLADRLMQIPVNYGTDQSDASDLQSLANKLALIEGGKIINDSC